MISGQLDAAWICGFPFVAYRPQLSLVAVPVWRGQPLYRSYLIAGRDQTAASLDDLKGDTHAFSDPDSNSGWLVTATALARQGLTPDRFFSQTIFTWGHRNVVRAVAVRPRRQRQRRRLRLRGDARDGAEPDRRNARRHDVGAPGLPASGLRRRSRQ